MHRPGPRAASSLESVVNRALPSTKSWADRKRLLMEKEAIRQKVTYIVGFLKENGYQNPYYPESPDAANSFTAKDYYRIVFVSRFS
jgi:hypothetical protein